MNNTMNFLKKFTKAEILEAINLDDSLRDKIAQILWDWKSQKLLDHMDEINIEMERSIGTLNFMILLEEANEVNKQYNKLEAEYKRCF